MKKPRIVLAAVLALVFACGVAPATDLGIHGAYWDTKEGDQAFGLGAKLRFSFFEIRGTYFDDVTADVEPEVSDFEIKAYPIEAGLVIQLLKNSVFRPYIGGGGGYYILETNL